MKFKIKAELSQDKLDFLNDNVVEKLEVLTEREISELSDFIQSGDEVNINDLLVAIEHKLKQVLSSIEEYRKED